MPCGLAGAGTNNIPRPLLEAGIVTTLPGANANAVKERRCALCCWPPKDQRRRGLGEEQAAAVGGRAGGEGQELQRNKLSARCWASSAWGHRRAGGQHRHQAGHGSLVTTLPCRWTEFLSCPGWSTGPRIWRPFIELRPSPPRPPRDQGTFNEDAFHAIAGGGRISTWRGHPGQRRRRGAPPGQRQVACRHRLPNGKILRATWWPSPIWGLHAGERELRRHGGPGV